jgi:hypothetical protein
MSLNKNSTKDFFILAQTRKLSDVFSNGFVVPDDMKLLVSRTVIKKYGFNANELAYKNRLDVYTLFDVVLYALTNDDQYGCNQYCSWFIVKNDAGKVIGYTTNPLTEEDRRNVITVQYSQVFKQTEDVIRRFQCTVKLMFQVAINTTKTIYKSNLHQYIKTDTSVINSALKKIIGKKTQEDIKTRDQAKPQDSITTQLNSPIDKQMQAILDADINSVLHVPVGSELQFTSGDLTQLQILYKSQQEELGAALQIPLTKLFGTPPVGFQSTGEYDRKSYEQTLEQIANEYCVPILRETARIIGYSDEEVEKIKYLSVYQIEQILDLVEKTYGIQNNQVQEMVEVYIESKTGIKKNENVYNSNNNNDTDSKDDDSTDQPIDPIDG